MNPLKMDKNELTNATPCIAMSSSQGLLKP